ncbi:hypothetical protein [Paraburkholderia bryophila]|uniref:Killing trait domain-containing protein n=1 Tax=Paraburkholderia bryophila TaxID=420952 RepID=A0A329CMM7_9BURK|nr:hypothetical protein [Paraburkholderia bryophila]RAS35979.1 hypothetical protein BX591_104310 [Paraburkholderia bryophila]
MSSITTTSVSASTASAQNQMPSAAQSFTGDSTGNGAMNVSDLVSHLVSHLVSALADANTAPLQRAVAPLPDSLSGDATSV